VPSSKGVSEGPMITAFLKVAVSKAGRGGGGALWWMAYQVMTLSAIGEAETPAGGSVCMRLKSRIRRLLAAVDMLRGRVRVVVVEAG
jgi:hypothetical protein